MSTIETPTLEQALNTLEVPNQETFSVERPETQEQVSMPVIEKKVLPVSAPIKEENPSVVVDREEWAGYGYEPRAVDTDGNNTTGDKASKIVVDKRNNVSVTID